MKKNFTIISEQELIQFTEEGVELPARSAMITFDDGYKDNWIFSFLLLKKYGFKSTIWINPEFIDPRINMAFALYDKGKINESIELFNNLSFSSLSFSI